MRLIDADELKRVVLRAFPPVAYDQALLVGRIIDRMPTIDPVKHGLWIEHKGGDDYIGYPIYECSECGYDAGETATNYCPNCGALMREDGEEG